MAVIRSSYPGIQLLLILVFLFCQMLAVKAQDTLRTEHQNQLYYFLNYPVADPDVYSVRASGSKVPLFGKTFTRYDSLFFRPVVALQNGNIYQVFKAEKKVDSFLVQAGPVTKPFLQEVYPQQDTLPENLLKFTLVFSEPMSAAPPYEYIHLVNTGHDTLHQAFLKQNPALWNQDQTELTLWLDPGRVKRKLTLNKKLGKPLEAGYTYSLIIDKNWRSASGTALGYAYQKQFVTKSADRKKPDIMNWKVITPERESGLLSVIANEGIDYASAVNRMDVTCNGESLPGSWKTETGRFYFLPAEPWQMGTYQLRVDTRVEDLAGNNFNRLFDRDITGDKKMNHPFVEITFEVIWDDLPLNKL